jgi:hypothetical protein
VVVCVLCVTYVKPLVFGAAVASPLVALGYFFVPAYHDYLVAGWSSPLTWAVGLVVGVTAAVVTD